MSCGFCLTGKMGLVRNLTAGEIAGQVRVPAATGLLDRTFNIVLMGMGEPLHNYDNTLKALRMSIRSMASRYRLDGSRCRLSVLFPASTAWLENPDAELAISLHATTDQARTAPVPPNRKCRCRRFSPHAGALKKRSRITPNMCCLPE